MFESLTRMFLPRSRYIQVVSLNDVYLQTAADMQNALGGNVQVSPVRKRTPYRTYVIDFVGDVMATSAHALSQEVTAILVAAEPKFDDVLVRVESAGGAVHSYGYAASQINRLKEAGLPVTVAVDKVAASGGYMMACVANKIIAAPFAIVGSIGVVAELPNFNKIITELGVVYKQYTAGKYKRTVGTFAPITDDGESKFIDDLNHTHDLFKSHVSKNRPSVDIDKVATGEHWYGQTALGIGLVDEIMTSDDFIYKRMKDREVLKIVYMANKKWEERMRGAVVASFESLLIKTFSLIFNYRFLS